MGLTKNKNLCLIENIDNMSLFCLNCLPLSFTRQWFLCCYWLTARQQTVWDWACARTLTNRFESSHQPNLLSCKYSLPNSKRNLYPSLYPTVVVSNCAFPLSIYVQQTSPVWQTARSPPHVACYRNAIMQPLSDRMIQQKSTDREFAWVHFFLPFVETAWGHQTDSRLRTCLLF